MAKSTKKTTDEIVEKSEVAVEVTEVAPEADANIQEVAKAAPCADCGKAMDACECDSKSETAEESTEKAAKPSDEETPAEDAIEKPGDEEAEDKKPMAPKSDDVVAEAVTETNDGLEKAFSDLVEIVKSLQSEVELLKSTKVDIEVAQSSFEAVAKDIASATNVFNEFGKRVELVEQDTAFRKSGDLGEIVQDQPEMVEKSLWGGSFLKTTDLFK